MGSYDDAEELEADLKRLLAEPPRLFSSSLNSYIMEWDPQTLTAKKLVDSNGGAVWCLAVNSDSSRLAAGCEDGCIRVFDITNGQLEYQRRFESQKGRILSITWGPDDSYIVSGGYDSSVRKWNVETGRTTHRMTVDKKNKEPTMVWTVAATKNNTIVSGDSLGNLMFWDSEIGTMKQSLKVHGADILSVVVSQDGNLLFSAGVDRKVVVCRRVQQEKNKMKASRGTWATIGSHRYHSHDIRALALDASPEINSIVSGGVDVELIVSPALEYPRLPANRITPFARKNLVSLSKSHKMVLARFFDTVSLWKLGQAGQLDTSTIGSLPEMYEPHEFLLKLQLKDDCYITSAALSENAQWIAACDVENIRLFKIQSQDGESDQLMVKKVREFDLSLSSYLSQHDMALGGHHVLFTPSSDKLIVVTVESKILVIDLSHWEQDEFEVLAEFKHHNDISDNNNNNNNTQTAPRTVTNIVVSEDGQWLGTNDDQNNTYVYSLDNLKRNFVLPRSSVPQTVLSFNPFRPNELFVAYADNTFRLFDIEHKCQTKWSKKHNNQSESRLATFRDRIRGVTYNPSDKNKIVVYGSVFMAQVDVTNSKANLKINHKRKADQHDVAPVNQQPGFEVTLTSKFKHILHCDFLDANSMVVVERTKESLLETLPLLFMFPTSTNRQYIFLQYSILFVYFSPFPCLLSLLPIHYCIFYTTTYSIF
ncbi:unnamed protein product [Absidia cylindrospora]